MNMHTSDICEDASAVAGGAPNGADSMDHHYGRRVERDGSWSIYHVFSGTPAMIEGRSLTGMSQACATQGMLAMNRRNENRSRDRSGR